MLRKIILVLFIVAALAISFGCPPVTPVDTDEDGVADVDDNCPTEPNTDQADADFDGAGDACDTCPDDPDNDIDGDTVCGDIDNCPTEPNTDQANDDGDVYGDACDPCLGDELNECLNDPVVTAVALLSIPVGECETYVGAHPVPDHTATLTQTYEFCGDGTVSKTWNPDPSSPIPGEYTSTGTWVYTGSQLLLDVTSALSPTMIIDSTEQYQIAYTYDDGAMLDLFSVVQTFPGDGSTVLGNYSAHTEVTVVMGDALNSLILSDVVTAVEDDDADDIANWNTTRTDVATCTGMFCTEMMNGTTVTETSGTIDMPGALFELDGVYILQTSDTLSLVRQ